MIKNSKDHLGRTISYQFPPQRIISLVPSITETLFSLGLGDQIVGRTRYCVHPESDVKHVKKVGGTKQVKMDVIDELQPDLIICEKEENTPEIVESLAEKYPVFVTEVETYDDALKMILDLGELTDRYQRAQEIVTDINNFFAGLSAFDGPNIAYLIWRKPYMVAGGDTYINSILEKCGFKNVFKGHHDRYPSVTAEDLQAAKPDYLFLSSEPFPYSEKYFAEFEAFMPNTKLIIVDGEIFSWSGARMLHGVPYLNHLINSIKNS